MTPEQINKSIANAHLGVFTWENDAGECGGWTNSDGDICDAPPSYYDDLNACHEMAKEFDAIIGNRFLKRLDEVCARDFENEFPNLDGPTFSFYFNNATAPQRCEAFLKTLNLWEDQE